MVKHGRANERSWQLRGHRLSDFITRHIRSELFEHCPYGLFHRWKIVNDNIPDLI